jgi:hypothetical protein
MFRVAILVPLAIVAALQFEWSGAESNNDPFTIT